MKPDITTIAKSLAIAAAAAVFLGLPMLLYLLDGVPRRSALKEGLSIATLLAFTFMLGQYFLARSNTALFVLFKAPAVQKVHKWFAYGAIAVIALHPVFIVLPRAFEAGVKPWDAFWSMITTFDNLGILLGLFAWIAMILLGVTAWFRLKLMKRFKNKYRGWRAFHGLLAVSFTIAAIWHAIALGRHTDLAMSLFFVALAAAGFVMLARLYLPERPRLAGTAPRPAALAEGTK